MLSSCQPRPLAVIPDSLDAAHLGLELGIELRIGEPYGIADTPIILVDPEIKR